jgi:hypothetical protein
VPDRVVGSQDIVAGVDLFVIYKTMRYKHVILLS